MKPSQKSAKKSKQTRPKTSKTIYAERRSRYIAAIEQLSNRENATTRLGGVYAHIGLIDDWLADGALLTDKERRKEGQALLTEDYSLGV